MLDKWKRIGRLFLVLILASTSLAQLEAPSPIVEANSRFAFKLFRQLTSDNPQHNILVAPTGLSLSFGLLENGSDPETRKEIEAAFEFTGMDLAQINEGFAGLRKELKQGSSRFHGKESKGSPSASTDNPDQLVIADSLWMRQGYFSNEFLDTSRKFYGLDLQQVLPSQDLSAQISRWASERVRNKLSIDMSPRANNDFFMVDVTRFHSSWERSYEFDESMTGPAGFTMPDGRKKVVPMMHNVRRFKYLEGPKFQAVILPYRLDASMYILLPAKDSSLSELEENLTTTNWHVWLSGFKLRQGVLGLPKFKIDARFDVLTGLQELGVKRVFQQFVALRRAVTIPEGARLTDVLQKTEITVDEKKTEVVSEGIIGGIAGGIPGGSGSEERPMPFEMLVNRPFFFAIQHNSTGQLLFLGAVVEP